MLAAILTTVQAKDATQNSQINFALAVCHQKPSRPFLSSSVLHLWHTSGLAWMLSKWPMLERWHVSVSQLRRVRPLALISSVSRSARLALTHLHSVPRTPRIRSYLRKQSAKRRPRHTTHHAPRTTSHLASHISSLASPASRLSRLFAFPLPCLAPPFATHIASQLLILPRASPAFLAPHSSLSWPAAALAPTSISRTCARLMELYNQRIDMSCVSFVLDIINVDVFAELGA